MDNRPIGVFDSGVGGLTVAREIIKKLPNEEIIYFGDTARLPYGDKTKETIIKYSRQIIKFLISQEVKAVVIACGTASSNALVTISQEFSTLPIKGVVEPGALAATKATKNNKIGIIGTEGTIRSGAYEKIIKSINSNIEVFQKACPLFVPLAEEGWTDGQIAELTAKEYLKGLLAENIDTLVLACTHYPLLRDCIQRVAGDRVKLVDPAEQTADELKLMLEEKNALRAVKMSPNHKFYVSDNTNKFAKLALNVLNRNYEAEKLEID